MIATRSLVVEAVLLLVMASVLTIVDQERVEAKRVKREVVVPEIGVPTRTMLVKQ